MGYSVVHADEIEGEGRTGVIRFIRRRLEVEGGWYAVLRVPATQADEDLAIEILRKLFVLVHPGHFYDFPSDGYLIVSLITPPENFRHGITQILNLLNP